MAKNTSLYVNNGRTILAANITSTTTTIPVADISKLPQPVPGQSARVTLDDGVNSEIVYYTGFSGNNLTGCVRGYEGTSPKAFTALSTRVENRLTAGNISQFCRLQDKLDATDWVTSLYNSDQMDSNSYYITQQKDQYGETYLTLKNDSYWSVIGHGALVVPETTVTVAGTKTSMSMPADLKKKLAYSFSEGAAGQLVIFTGGGNVGKIRKISSITSTINWASSDALPVAVAVGDTYKIVSRTMSSFEYCSTLDQITTPVDMNATSLMSASSGKDFSRLVLIKAGPSRWYIPSYGMVLRSGATVTSSTANTVTWNLDTNIDPVMGDTSSKSYIIQVTSADNSTTQLRFVTAFTNNSVTVDVNWTTNPAAGSYVYIYGCTSNVGKWASAVPLMNGTANTGDSTRMAREDHVHPTDTSRAPLASPALTGNPTAPTQAATDNSTRIATTAFVKSLASTSSPSMNGTAAVGTSAYYARADHVHPTDTSRAPLASPAFTGTPTAPTPASTDNSTRVATTAYVRSLGSNTAPTMNGTGTPGSSYLYARGDHVHPTDTSRAPLNSPAFQGTPSAPIGSTWYDIGWRSLPIKIVAPSALRAEDRGCVIANIATGNGGSGTIAVHSQFWVQGMEMVNIFNNNGSQSITVTIGSGVSSLQILGDPGTASGTRTIDPLGMATIFMVNNAGSFNAYITGVGVS